MSFLGVPQAAQGSGYALQVLAALRAFRCYPSRDYVQKKTTQNGLEPDRQIGNNGQKKRHKTAYFGESTTCFYLFSAFLTFQNETNYHGLQMLFFGVYSLNISFL